MKRVGIFFLATIEETEGLWVNEASEVAVLGHVHLDHMLIGN